MNFAFLSVFALLSVGTGALVVRFLLPKIYGLSFVTLSVLLGFFVSVWLTYLLAMGLSSINSGVQVACFLLAIGVYSGKKSIADRRLWNIPLFDSIILAGSIAISFWLMFKSFHAGEHGMLLIGTNEVFDFGHAISVIRSFSSGYNIPYSSPFIAGTPHIYHFMFYFWAGILERFGLSLVWAFNTPAIIAMSGLLCVVYVLTKYFFGSVRAGLVALFLTLTHSTLTFLYFFTDQSKISGFPATLWRNASYYFAGPFDGSIISIFWTLNVFVNQRHLVFGLSVILAYVFIVFLMLDSKKTPHMRQVGILGVLAGLMVWWHTMLFLALVFVIACLFYFRRMFTSFFIFIAVSLGVGLVQLAPWLGAVPSARDAHGSTAFLYWFLSSDGSAWVKYWIWNLGIALVTIPLGYRLLPPGKRVLVWPFMCLFLMANFVRVGRDILENHKLLNLVILVGNILSAGAVAWLWEKKGRVGKLVSVLLLSFLGMSGVIDVMVIKNDFQYPVADYEASPFMQWVATNTKTSDVFLSYQDIFDPVGFAGRKTYAGFFGARAYSEKMDIVRRIYEATSSSDFAVLSDEHIAYVVVPKGKKEDFPYAVDVALFRSQFPSPYEDDRIIVFKSDGVLIE